MIVARVEILIGRKMINIYSKYIIFLIGELEHKISANLDVNIGLLHALDPLLSDLNTLRKKYSIAGHFQKTFLKLPNLSVPKGQSTLHYGYH